MDRRPAEDLKQAGWGTIRRNGHPDDSAAPCHWQWRTPESSSQIRSQHTRRRADTFHSYLG
jgi:hypothetical protein